MKKDLLWNSLGTSAWSFIYLFLLIIVTRINGIVDSGLFSFAFAVALIMFTVACYGGRTYQVSDHTNSFTSNDYISLRLLTTASVIVLIILFVIVNGYDGYKATLILILVGHRVFDALADVFYGILQKKDRLYVAGRSLFYKSVLSLVAFYIVDVTTHSLLLSALTLPVISLLFIIFYDIPSSKAVATFSIRPKLHGIKKILGYTFLPFTIAVLGLIFANIARYFIDIYHPNSQGYFGIIIMPLSMVILLFSFISTPIILQMTKQYNDRKIDALYRTVNKIIGLTCIATLVLCILTYYLGASALHLLFNLNFEDYTLDIVLVIVTGLAISLTALFTNVAIIARRLKLTSIVYLGSSLLLATLCIPLVSRYGIRGAIVAYIIASYVQAAIMCGYYLYITSSYRLSRKS